MQMMRHDDPQRSDRLGVRRAWSADRRAGRGKVLEARIAVDFLRRPWKMVIRVDQMRIERHDDSQRSGRLAVTQPVHPPEPAYAPPRPSRRPQPSHIPARD